MINPQRFPSQFFPTRVIEAAERYHSNEELRSNPPEGLKVEAALLMVVCASILWAQF